MSKTDKTALLVIDVQAGFFKDDMSVHQSDVILQRIKGLIDKARSANIDVIYVRHDEAPEFDGPIHPEIAPRTDEVIVSKMTPDSFFETNLGDVLKEKATMKLVIVGMQTEFCVDTTTRRAKSEGYQVTLVSDAHSTFDSDYTPISAEQIIGHHNAVLEGFAEVKPMSEIVFN